MRRSVEASVSALSNRNFNFFRAKLGTDKAWRAFPEFRSKSVYLDIETDGGRSGSSITTIGLYDGNEFRALIKGRDLHLFPEIMAEYEMVITFFGTGFDIPMLRKGFPDVPFDQIHIDLCPTLRQVGIRGGLKKIEKQLGINRGEDTDGLDGLDAIRLWRRYTILNDEDALETLIAYNREDVVNMERLMEYTYDRLSRETLGDHY
jgi:uncharacterized protein YprB with RNaseH-like and TPR domain